MMPSDTPAVDKPLRTQAEREVGPALGRIFDASSESTEVKLENFTKYVRRNHLKRFLAMYEIFKMALPVKGSIVECGVYKGFGLMAWAKLSAMLEPENLTRRIYGFDTFQGFPSVSAKDEASAARSKVGDLNGESYDELLALIEQFDKDRFLGHIPKVHLVKGDIASTLPAFLDANPHLVVSLLFIDCDLFEPTKAALDALLPRMPKGAVLAFDELDNPIWPGETRALVESVGVRGLRLQRFSWDPYISYATLE